MDDINLTKQKDRRPTTKGAMLDSGKMGALKSKIAHEQLKYSKPTIKKYSWQKEEE